MAKKLLVRRFLEFPKIYSWFENIISRKDGRLSFTKTYIGDVSGKRVLDLGCGTADILGTFNSEACYVGIDNNRKYINSNKARFKARETCRFYYTDLNTYAKRTKQLFDIVLMIGVLHHISDDEVESAMESIKKLLAPGGIFISADCCYVKGMNPIARFLCMMDRGEYVRYVSDYIKMQKEFFDNVWYEVRTDTLGFLPYSLIVFKNRKV